jgi:hypothetical protein
MQLLFNFYNNQLVSTQILAQHILYDKLQTCLTFAKQYMSQDKPLHVHYDVDTHIFINVLKNMSDKPITFYSDEFYSAFSAFKINKRT